MKRALYIVWLMMIPMAAAAVVEEEEVKEIVEEKYAQFNKALVGRDLGALTAICTADCKFKTRPGGASLSLDQFKKFRERGFKTITVKRAVTTVDSVVVHGDRATIRATWKGDLTAKSGKTTRNLRSFQKVLDTWTHADADWKLSSSTVQSTRNVELATRARSRQ